MIGIKETDIAGLKAGDFSQTIEEHLVKLVPLITLKAGYIFTRPGALRETDKNDNVGFFRLLLTAFSKE